MKIKELHLRNIASIEKADIDFESGLNDIANGSPASIFLISGDTGAGKSVILDGISMALYKKTPRIIDVQNKTNNNFTDDQGDSISINSIEQYTRLGISYKDECYSEVVFEGNDGKEYHAKLELGLKKSNKKDKDGNYLIKHSTPVWTVKVGSDDWQKVEAKTGQPILDAVGLTFEQFGRMAMLAQGQFASFLTGDKKERESILEQLTNTEHFTAYGEAIKRLFDNAKTAQKTAQTAFDTEKEHTLPLEQVEQHNKDLDELKIKEKDCKQQIDCVDKKIKAVEQIELSSKAKHTSEDAMRSLEERINGENYKSKLQLVADWDSTVTERQRLIDMQTSQKKLTNAKEDEASLLTTFVSLSSDLAARKDALDTETQDIAADKVWLDERADRDVLYTKHGEITLQLKSYKEKVDKQCAASKALAEEISKTVPLAGELSKATDEAKAKTDAVVKKQQEIDEVIAMRDALNPNAINRRLTEIGKEKSVLERLTERIVNYKQKAFNAITLAKDIKTDENTLTEMRAKMDSVKTAADNSKKEYDEANNRLATMNHSMEDVFVTLRKRLINEHDEFCPLCGQKLEKIHMEEEFRHILTPIEKEQQEKEAAYKAVEEKYNKAKSSCDTFAGSLDTKKKQYDTLVDEIKKDEAAIREEAQKTDVVILETFVPDDTLTAINIAVDEKTTEEDTLKQKQKEITKLQDKVTKLLNEKKPLDSAKTQADKRKADAENGLNTNEKTIKRLSGEQEDIAKELKSLSDNINCIIGTFYGNWSADVTAVIQTITTEAKTYLANKTEYERRSGAIRNMQALIDTLQGNFDSLLNEFPGYQPADEHVLFECKDIKQEWTHLISSTGSVKNQIKSLSDSITECHKVLDTYYNTSGKTEEYLNSISERKDELEGARLLIKQTGEELKSHSDAIAAADEIIKESMQKLGVKSLDDLPIKEELTTRKNELNGLHDDIVGKMGSLKQQLEDNEKNIAKRNEAEKELLAANQVYAKWDILNNYFGGTRFRTLVQTYVLRPLLNNANIYLEKITDRYKLTCSEENDQLSILVHDLYNKGQVRSATILSGGERFMISLALSLALSSLNRPDMNVNILFIDEGFGTLDENNLNSVMSTLEKLQEIAGQSNRRVGIISHREELEERIPVKIVVKKHGEGRSMIEMKYE